VLDEPRDRENLAQHNCQLLVDQPPDPDSTEDLKEKKRKDSAGSDDAASMVKGGGYIGTDLKFSLCTSMTWAERSVRALRVP
jgi:hypothetical protein